MSVRFDNRAKAPESGFDLDRLQLRFRDLDVEARYRRESLNEARVIIRTYLVAAAGLYMAFGILDSVVGAGVTTELLFIRYALVCPILLGAAALTYLPSFEKFSQLTLAVAMIAPGIGIVIMTSIMPPPYNSFYYAGLIMVVIYGASLVRLRFLISALISLMLVATWPVAVARPRVLAKRRKSRDSIAS